MTSNPRVLTAAGLIAGVIIAIGVAFMLPQAPAKNAAANEQRDTPTVAAPAPTPRPVRNKPVEQAPPVPTTVPGDGVWTVGKEIKRGTYRSDGGATCYWSRKGELAGNLYSLESRYGNGPQVVVLAAADTEFVTGGCASWERIS